MRRIVILTLLFLVITACGRSQTRNQETSQVGVNTSASPTLATQVVSITPQTTILSTLAVTQIPVQSNTPSVPAITTSTSAPTSVSTLVGTEASPTPTESSFFEVVTRTRSTDGMMMVFVPAGEFSMGSPAGEGSDEEVPNHKLTLSEFWIDRTEVTNDQYRTFVNASGHQAPTTCDWGDPTYGDETMANHPVVCVSWEDAAAYCEWAGGRLPTEAEWEKAARGTDRLLYPWGNSFDGTKTNFCDINCTADFKNTAWDDGYAMTAPVGSYPMGSSPYGALDMAGNVWEWVADWFGFYYYGSSPTQDPPGPKSGQYKALRGGSWWGYETNERTAFRGWNKPESRDIVTGFRCIVSSLASP